MDLRQLPLSELAKYGVSGRFIHRQGIVVSFKIVGCDLQSDQTGAEVTLTTRCTRGAVSMSYVLFDHELGQQQLNQFIRCFDLLGPNAIPTQTRSLKLSVVPEDKKRQRISERFSRDEVLGLLGDLLPCEENFGRIVIAIKHKKGFPDLDEEIPWKQVRSKQAQGQTKKIGSHSESRHNRK